MFKLQAGRPIATRICADVTNAASHLQKAHGLVPQLAIIEVGEHNYGNLLKVFKGLDGGPVAVVESSSGLSNYAQLKASMAERCGMRSRLLRFSESVSQLELLKVIGQLMDDDAVHGIALELPLPVHLNEQQLLGAISWHKDVDGGAHENVSLLSMRRGQPLSAPPVATGIVELLVRSGVPLSGQDVVVLGRSNTVGLPVAAMLQKLDCTVTVCHSQTRDLEKHVRRADIVIASVGKPNFVRGSWLKPGSVVIDVGMNAATDEKGEFKIVGDVCYAEAKEVTPHVSTVPGGVGHISFAIMLRNVVNLARHSIGLEPLAIAPSTIDPEQPLDFVAKIATIDTLHFPDIGLRVPSVLLPRAGTDLTKWCIIACDQYTSEPKYWKEIRDSVGDAPSTLNLIFPEVYMGKGQDEQIIQGIRDKMYEYDRAGILQKRSPGFMLVDRKTPVVESRKGLLVELDLEHYSFEQGSQSMIRATEQTIEARLPPRIAIREHASIELPHIMVLIDDPDKTVIEPLVQERDNGFCTPMYDFELMKGSGHMRGHHVTSRAAIERAVAAIRKLGERKTFVDRYDAPADRGQLLYGVGDGNHSLATAKRCWEALKRKGAADDHPARFALVELMNVHDPGLDFEPIHRLLIKVSPTDLMNDFRLYCKRQGLSLKETPGGKMSSGPGRSSLHEFEFRLPGKKTILFAVSNPTCVLAAATLTPWLDAYLKSHDAEVDYVHGTDVIDEGCAKDDKTAGILLASMDKNDLFRTVVHEGVLPRKTFSMGEADEKRFYFEAKRIVPETVYFRSDFFRRGHVSTALQAPPQKKRKTESS